MRETDLTRWSASKTTFGVGQNDHHRCREPHRRPGAAVRVRLGWSSRRPGPGWQAPGSVRASAAAALRTGAAAARALRRKDSAPVTADEESFTAAWRHAIRSI